MNQFSKSISKKELESSTVKSNSTKSYKVTPFLPLPARIYLGACAKIKEDEKRAKEDEDFLNNQQPKNITDKKVTFKDDSNLSSENKTLLNKTDHGKSLFNQTSFGNANQTNSSKDPFAWFNSRITQSKPDKNSFINPITSNQSNLQQNILLEKSKRHPYGDPTFWDNMLKSFPPSEKKNISKTTIENKENKKEDDLSSFKPIDVKSLKRKHITESKSNLFIENDEFPNLNFDWYRQDSKRLFYSYYSRELVKENEFDQGKSDDENINIDFLAFRTIPSLENIEKEGITKIENFKVYSRYGMIHFLEPIDLHYLPDYKKDLKASLFKVLKFSKGYFEFFPDETFKPNLGDGLNVKFKLELIDVFIIDPFTEKPALNTNLKLFHVMYSELIEKLKGIKDLDFVSYDYITGKAIFNSKFN